MAEKKEYIVQITDFTDYGKALFVGGMFPDTELIRCKDCKYYDMSDPSGTVEPIGYRCKRVTRLWREPDDHCKGAVRKEE